MGGESMNVDKYSIRDVVWSSGDTDSFTELECLVLRNNKPVLLAHFYSPAVKEGYPCVRYYSVSYNRGSYLAELQEIILTSEEWARGVSPPQAPEMFIYALVTAQLHASV